MFEPLTLKEIEQVVRIQLDGVVRMLKGNGVDLKFRDEAVNWISQMGFDPEFGARPVKRVIQRMVLDPLSRQLLAGTIDKSKSIIIDMRDGELDFKN